MRQFEGKYFKIYNGIIKIKEMHDNNYTADDTVWVEVDDFCGDFYAHLTEKVWLNNENLLFHASNMFISNLEEVSEQRFTNNLIDQLNKSIVKFESGDECPFLFWKKTPKRLELLRKRYKNV